MATKRLFAFVFAALAGSVLPASASASSAPSFSITVLNAKVVVPVGQKSVSFGVFNGGTATEQIVVSPQDDWIKPDETGFELAPRQTHWLMARVAIPQKHDAGDLDTLVFFTVPADGVASSTSTVRVARGVAALVIIATGEKEHHDLRGGLSAPSWADSSDSPTVRIDLVNRGNIHEVVSLAPWGELLLPRDETKHLTLAWTSHPWLGYGTIRVAGQTASTLFLPVKAVGSALLALLGLALILRTLRGRFRLVRR